MPRPLCIFLALIAGCVIALAVAAVRSLAVDYRSLTPMLVTDAKLEVYRRDWQANRPARFPEVTEFKQIDGTRGVGITIVGVGIQDQTSIHRLMRVRAGWPMKCVEGDDWRHESLAPDTNLPGSQMIVGGNSTYVHLGVVLPDQIPMITMSRGKYVPYGVVWVGLAINTLVFAILVMLTFVGIARWRAKRRAAIGCCRACGYQLKDLARCPECGTPTNSRRTAVAPAE